MKNHLQFQDEEADRNTGLNFSVFSRIAGIKCTDRCSRVAGRSSSNSVMSRFEEITADNDYEKPPPAEGNRQLAELAAEGSNSYTLPQFQRATIIFKDKVGAKTCKESIADGHSKAHDHNKKVLRMDTLCHQLLADQSSDKESDHQEKENAHARADTTVYTVTSSVGSHGASNAQTNSNYRNKHYHQPEGKRKHLQARDDTEVKRTRHSKTHEVSKKKRRDEIRKKMRTLQQLIPCCKKKDKISVLDETIEYLKILQLQLRILSMGRGLYMPSVNTMIPTTTSVALRPTRFFNQMTSGMSPSNSSSMFGSLTHFPCLQVDTTATAGIPGNMFQMFGFPWQMHVLSSIPQPSHNLGVENPEK